MNAWQYFFKQLPQPKMSDIIQKFLQLQDIKSVPKSFFPILLHACDLMVTGWVTKIPCANSSEGKQMFVQTVNWFFDTLETLRTWIRDNYVEANSSSNPVQSDVDAQVNTYANIYENLGKYLQRIWKMLFPCSTEAVTKLNAMASSISSASKAKGNISSSREQNYLLEPVLLIRRYITLGTGQQLEMQIKLRIILLHYYHRIARSLSTQQLASMMKFLDSKAIMEETQFLLDIFEFSNPSQSYILSTVHLHKIKMQQINRAKYQSTSSIGNSSCDVTSDSTVVFENIAFSIPEMCSVAFFRCICGSVCNDFGAVEATLNHAPVASCVELIELFLSWTILGGTFVPSYLKDVALNIYEEQISDKDIKLFINIAAATVATIPEKIMRRKWCFNILTRLKQLDEKYKQTLEIYEHGNDNTSGSGESTVQNSIVSLAICAFNDGVGFARSLEFSAAENSIAMALQLLSQQQSSKLKKQMTSAYSMVLSMLQQHKSTNSKHDESATSSVQKTYA